MWISRRQKNLSLQRNVLVGAVRPAQHPVQHDDAGRDGPAEHDQPLDELFLGHERRHQDRVQVEALAQHPRVVGDQEVVQHQVQRDAGGLKSGADVEKRG